MPWTTVADSDIGGREEQQDRVLIESGPNGHDHLLVVADGAGGHAAGALAAQTAIDCIKLNLHLLWASKDPHEVLHNLIIKCNQQVRLVGNDDLACSTLVVVLMRHDEIFWGHVGDSRLYLIRDGHVVANTIDHSVAELERQAPSDTYSLSSSALKNTLYNCLGAHEDIEPELSSSLVRDGDTLLLCSDGLWGQIEMGALITEIGEHGLSLDSIKKWVQKAKASKAEYSDNITVIAAKYSLERSLFFKPLSVLASLFKK